MRATAIFDDNIKRHTHRLAAIIYARTVALWFNSVVVDNSFFEHEKTEEKKQRDRSINKMVNSFNRGFAH